MVQANNQANLDVVQQNTPARPGSAPPIRMEDIDEVPPIYTQPIDTKSVHTQAPGMGVEQENAKKRQDDFFDWYFGACWDQNWNNLKILDDRKHEGTSALDVFLKQLFKADHVESIAENLFENGNDF